jgi:hypothetical protein
MSPARKRALQQLTRSLSQGRGDKARRRCRGRGASARAAQMATEVAPEGEEIFFFFLRISNFRQNVKEVSIAIATWATLYNTPKFLFWIVI